MHLPVVYKVKKNTGLQIEYSYFWINDETYPGNKYKETARCVDL